MRFVNCKILMTTRIHNSTTWFRNSQKRRSPQPSTNFLNGETPSMSGGW